MGIIRNARSAAEKVARGAASIHTAAVVPNRAGIRRVCSGIVADGSGGFRSRV
jgi:hypothetical protein